MGGFASITGQGTYVYADNASFDGTERDGGLTTNGQLWIGNTATGRPTVNTLTAGTGIGITNGAGTITISYTATSGDVFGPASSTDNAICRFDGTTGKLIQNSSASIDDNGNITVVGSTLNGYQIVKLTETAISYSVLSTDYLIGVTSTAAARTITLPAAASSSGKVFIVKDQSGGAATNNITVTVTGGATNIDNATTFVINTNYGAANFYSNGTQYYVF